MGIFGKKKEQELTERTFKVEGMMCSHCEMSVKNKLAGLPGVESVSASSALGKVCVTSSSDVTDDMICNAIADAGYTVVR